MLRIYSTYLASGNFLCTFCTRWRREGKHFQVMAFSHGLERRYITSCQNTIKWTMTRLPYMTNSKHASTYTRIDEKSLKGKAGGKGVAPRKQDGRSAAITLLNCHVSQKTSKRGDWKQIHSGKIESSLSLMDRKNPAKRMISKAVKALPEESLAKRSQRLIRESEVQKLRTWEKFGKTAKTKPNHKIYGITTDKTKSKFRFVGKNGAVWDRATAERAEKAFVEFQEMLRDPKSSHVEKLLHEQDLRRKPKPKPIKKKMVNVFKVSDPHVKQRLQKNKINMGIYDQTHLLKQDEPQCEFAEVQCGRKKLYVAFLEDGTPENVADKLPIKKTSPVSKAFPEKLMKMVPARLSKITPEKIVKMIQDGKGNGVKLVKMIHDKPPKGGPDKPQNGGRDRSLQLKIPRKSSDLKVVVNIKEPQENTSCPTIQFKENTPNGVVAKTMKFQIKKMEKYLFYTNNGKIRIRFLTGGLTNIKQRLIEKIEVPKLLKCPVAVSSQGNVVLYEKVEEPNSAGPAQDTSGTSLPKPKESLVQKLLNARKVDDKAEENKGTERRHLFRILKRKPRKVANEKVDEGKLIEAQLNNNASETFSKFDTLLQNMGKPKEDVDTKSEMITDQGKQKTPEEARPSSEKKISLPKAVPKLINKQDDTQEKSILPKPKPKTTLPTWKEIEKINREKQAEFSRTLPSQLIDPYFVQLQQPKLKLKEIQEQVMKESEPISASGQWDPNYQGGSPQAEEWSQTAQVNPTSESFPVAQGSTHQGVESISSGQQDQVQTKHSQENQTEWHFPEAETQPTGHNSQAKVDLSEQSNTSNSTQPLKNDFYYPEIRHQRSRRSSGPPPITEQGTTHFVSLLTEPEQNLAPTGVQVATAFEEREVQMYDTQLEETISKPVVEDMKLKDPDIILREDLPDYLPKNIINEWDDKNWDVRQKWETRADKVPNLRKLVRANSGNADYIHSFIIESDTLGECYRTFRQTPDFTPKTVGEYNFKYDQEPEMRMFENVVAQNFTRVDDPDFIQVKKLQNNQSKVETKVTNVTVIHPEVKAAPQVNTTPQNPVHSQTGLSAQNQVVANVLGTSSEGDSYIAREQTSQVTQNGVNAEASIKPVFQKEEPLEMRRTHVTAPCASQMSEAKEVTHPEQDNPDTPPTQTTQSIGFRLGTPEKTSRTRTSVEKAPSEKLEDDFGYKALSEGSKGGKHENSKTTALEPGKGTKSDEVKPAKSSEKLKHKQEEEKVSKKAKESLTATADASSEKNKKSLEAKSSKITEKVREEADAKVKEEIMQKLKEELSSKLKNEWKVKLFDELADKIKPVIELKLTSDKPTNQIYLEKAKSEKLGAHREQPQVKDQLKEELKELKEELKKIKLKEELKQELKSELKGEFTSRTATDTQALNAEPVRLESGRVNEGSERGDVRRKSESAQATVGQKVSAMKDEQFEKDKNRDENSPYQNSFPAVLGWFDSSVEQAVKAGRPNVQSGATLDTSGYAHMAEKDTGKKPHHLPEKEHPYLPRWVNPPGKDQPEKEPQRPRPQPNKDHPYLPKWDPIPQRNPPIEPFHPQTQPPNQPYYPHTQPPYQPQTPNQPYQPYQPQPQQPTQPNHPQPQIPNQPYGPQTHPPNQPQTPNYSPYPSQSPTQEASDYENEVNHRLLNEVISTPAEETISIQHDLGERGYEDEAQPSRISPQVDEARTQPFRSLDEEAFSQSRLKYFKITLPEPKMEEGKSPDDLKAKHKQEQDPGKKKEDEKVINQQSRTKFFRGLISEKKNPDEKAAKEENQGKKYFRTLLPDQKSPGKFMKFKGDQKKPKEGKPEDTEKGKPNKAPGEIKLKELPPTKPEIKKSSDNKPGEILVKSIETPVEQSRKSEMETAKQVEATEQKKLIKHQQEAAAQKESETKKQLEAAEQKELLRQQQEAAAKRDLEIRKQQEEMERQYREALEARKREELARKVPGIAGYGVAILEQNTRPLIPIPPDKKPDNSKDDKSSKEKMIKFPGQESKTEKKSTPEEKGGVKKEETHTKPEVTSAERLKSFMDPMKFGKDMASVEMETSEYDNKKPRSAEVPPKKEADKEERGSPLAEWEKKILGGSDNSKINEGKGDKVAAKSDTEKGVHDKPKASKDDSKVADLGKRKSNLTEWEKEIDEQTSSFFGGMPDTAKEVKKTKDQGLVPKEEINPSDKKPKMHKEDDSEVLQARVEQYLNIYETPKKGSDTDSGTPITMTLPNIDQYDQSDMNDFFSAGLKTNDFNLYLPQEEAEEILKYSQKVYHEEPASSVFALDQTSVSPSAAEMNLLLEPESPKTEATVTPKQESSVHVLKVVFQDEKSGVRNVEENKSVNVEAEGERELRSFVDLLRSVLPSKQRDRVKIFLENEASSKAKTDGERETNSDLNLCMQLLGMAVTSGKNESTQNRNQTRAFAAANNEANLQPLLELLKRNTNSKVEDGVKLEQEKARLGSYVELFRKAVDSAAREARESKTGAGDVQKDTEGDFRIFLQILKEAIAKLGNPTQEATAQGEQLVKKVEQDHSTGELHVNTSKKQMDKVGSAGRKDSKKGQSKIEDDGSAGGKISKEKTLEVQGHPELNVSKKKEATEEEKEALKKTIQVDKIIVNIKTDPEEIETSEKRRRPGRRMHRKTEEVSDEEAIEKQEKSTRKKKYRKKKLEEDTPVPKRKQEFLEGKRKRMQAEEDLKTSKIVPEKEPELEPGSELIPEIAEESTAVEYNAPRSDHSTLEVKEVSPKPKRESFMGEKIMKEFTIREEPFNIEPVPGKNKAVLTKRDVQSVEGSIRAARLDKGFMKEGKIGKFPRTILPDSPNVDLGRVPPPEEELEEIDLESGTKISKTCPGKEQTKMEEMQKAVKEENSEEEPVKIGEGKRDSKGYVKMGKKNVSGITQKRDLQTLATAMLRNTDENGPGGESVLGDELRHRIASAPFRKTELTHSEKEMTPIKDKTELKTVRIMAGEFKNETGNSVIGAAAKKANEIPCAVAVDPDNPLPPPPVLAGAVLTAKGRKPRTKIWFHKINKTAKNES